MKFVLPLSLGNTARHPQVLHPQKSWIHQEGTWVNGSPREYTHIHMGVHEVDIGMAVGMGRHWMFLQLNGMLFI
jgi:hypothetical protein